MLKHKIYNSLILFSFYFNYRAIYFKVYSFIYTFPLPYGAALSGKQHAGKGRLGRAALEKIAKLSAARPRLREKTSKIFSFKTKKNFLEHFRSVLHL